MTDIMSQDLQLYQHPTNAMAIIQRKDWEGHSIYDVPITQIPIQPPASQLSPIDSNGVQSLLNQDSIALTEKRIRDFREINGRLPISRLGWASCLDTLLLVMRTNLGNFRIHKRSTQKKTVRRLRSLYLLS